jgi:hypothetical protein
MDIKTLMRTNPQTLGAAEQEKALAEFVYQRLSHIAGMIRKGDYEGLSSFLLTLLLETATVGIILSSTSMVCWGMIPMINKRLTSET